MNKLNLRRISQILSEKEMKNVLGGSDVSGFNPCSGDPCKKSSECGFNKTCGCVYGDYKYCY